LRLADAGTILVQAPKLNDRSDRMTRFFFVPFDYEVVRAGRGGRAGRPVLRRDTAAIKIATLQRAVPPVAYRVKDERELGARWHLILRHHGKLWWPAVDKFWWQAGNGQLVPMKDARHLLRDLREGNSDLFVRRGLDDPRLKVRGQGIMLRDGREDALAEVHRNAKNLRIVGDCLYVAGGVPLLVEGYGIADAGADRVVAGPAGALRIKPANSHRRDPDLAIIRRRFYVPGSPELTAAMRRRPYYFRGVRVKTLDGDAVDRDVVRLDAAFRTAWRAMNKSIPRTRPDGFATLHDLFADACGPGDDDRLTAARAAALRGFVALFDKARPRPVAVSECLFDVQRALGEVKVPELLPPPAPPLTASEEAALASLYV
jgi:hypothetical protein